ncbi:unnamed protein product [Lymnaea stagnalis]|uniref:Uncharacterized protein n=1 Tax=Lymnaea stagnalis TaxID=6523 RepID=A0AAV2HAP3_LYMST
MSLNVEVGGTSVSPLPALDSIDTGSSRNINMKQFLCVKHALPKTRVTNTILYENSSQSRHLEMKLASLDHQKEQALDAMDINKRTFIRQQERKRRKWMREDQTRLSGLNLPTLPPSVVERRPSVQVICQCRLEKDSTSASPRRQPILPMMKIHKERTEIVLHRNRTFLTRLPSSVEIDLDAQQLFDAYRGASFLVRGLPCKDDRFLGLHTLLQQRPRKTKDKLWGNTLF